MPDILLTTLVKANLSLVFNLSRSIDFHTMSMQGSNETAIDGVTEGLISLGESVTWRAKHFGVYQTLTSKITAFDFPVYFIDEMQKGAFKHFKHEHIFEETDEGVMITDKVSFSSPFGIIGKIVDHIFLKKYLQSLLTKRNESIKIYAETDLWKGIPLLES